MSKHERLEVESEDAREERLRRLLESQDQRGPSVRAPSTSTLFVPGALGREGDDDSRLPDLLARLDEFLPQMAAANAELEQLDDPGSVNIEMERPDPHSGPYIRMDLGLGVFEQRRPRGGGSRSGSSSSSSSSSGSSSSSTGSSSSLSSSSGSGQAEEQDQDGDGSASSSNNSDSENNDSSDTDSGPDLFDILLGQAAGVLPARPVRPLPRRSDQQLADEQQQQTRIAVISSTDATDTSARDSSG
ncbi:hypothetical protein AURDEDRAFT_181718 [Auricularia subglabra TFB-10046 SS5]|nr:hypothetical protein AURDEDRAFT_181718 [Auricularia subglabra TFB-10046 SS5]